MPYFLQKYATQLPFGPVQEETSEASHLSRDITT